MYFLKHLIDKLISNIVYLFLGNRLKVINKYSDIGWAIVYSNYFLPVNLDKIFIRHKKSRKIIPLCRSPHYMFIKNYHEKKVRTNDYKNYIIEHFNEKDVEKKENSFIELYKEISENIINSSSHVESYSFIRDVFLNQKFLLCDGVHRASILKAIGVNQIMVNLVNKIIVK